MIDVDFQIKIMDKILILLQSVNNKKKILFHRKIESSFFFI